MPMNKAQRPFHVMVKPVGPVCNWHCDYCFYLDKKELFDGTEPFRMEEALQEQFIREYIQAQPGPVVPFAWQGGEPTLRGLDFFEKSVALQKELLPAGWKAENAFQTNGSLLDEEWCRFFRQNDFLIGLSLDGPPDVHDRYRHASENRSASSLVLAALQRLQEYQVEFNVLCVVSQANVRRPLDVYRFYRQQGIQHVQFIPLVEKDSHGELSSRSISGEEYGAFLVQVFTEWARHDYGQMFIQYFESCLAAMAGIGPGICILGKECGRNVILEHNGDVYACDHFVAPPYRLGNLADRSLVEMVDSAQQQRFGERKWRELADSCHNCSFRPLCNGACPKDWIEGKNHLCAGYKQFLSYASPLLAEMLRLIKRGTPPNVVKSAVAHQLDEIWRVGRNDPCPCQSGRKFKKCCG